MSERVGQPADQSSATPDTGFEVLQSTVEFRGPVEPLHGHEQNDHFALIYDEQAEQFATVIPYIKQGLERGERCLYIVDEGVIADSQLETIADAAGGDARVALSILRTAARQAQRQNLTEITDRVVEIAVPEARVERHEKDIETLTHHQRTLYQIIEEHEAISPSDLYEKYEQHVDDPKTNRTVRNYLSKMDQYDVIEAAGTSRDRTYRSVSETFDHIE
ncbi:MEDS domain-containing protein [Halorussus sp. AFM4]|uniref:MEDS domain-containing protein n=1 Tax=Halorussus sp. AFM4 TaxID=3421651 RepID=UPI003EBA7B42